MIAGKLEDVRFEFKAMDAAAVDYPDKSFDIVNIPMNDRS